MAASARSGERMTFAARVPAQRADCPATSPPSRAERERREVGGCGSRHPARLVACSGYGRDTTREVIRAFGPGRVNLIGEHTDYNGGLALPFAIDRGVTVEAEPLDGGEIRVEARDLGESDAFHAAAPGRAGRLARVRARHGGRAARGGRRRSAARGSRSRATSRRARACPPRRRSRPRCASRCWPSPAPRSPTAPSWHRLCSRVENDWVGAETGLLDQLASLRSRAGAALRIDFATLELRPVPLELGDWRLVTLDSGAEHSHAAGGYNERRAECRAACAALGVEHLSAADPEAAARLPEPLRRRARHVLSENARVEAMVAALAAGDMPAAGRLLDASHASLRDDYDASVPAVEAVVARLKAAGAAGARMVGGGFGGSVLALLEPGAEPPPGSVAVAPGPPARRL